MDVFQLRRRLVGDYSSYVRSFIRIKDARIEEEVERALEGGHLWPDPLIQLNPSFEAGETVEELVGEATLHEECASVFRRGKGPHNPGEDLRLHRHQAAVAVGCVRQTISGFAHRSNTGQRQATRPA